MAVGTNGLLQMKRGRPIGTAAFVSDCKIYLATTTRKSERWPFSNSMWKR